MKHVVVIGGGIAGTAAAHWLVKHGYRVTIVEQNDYLGGRIHTQLVRGTAVEMGAGFLTKDYINLQSFLVESGLDKELYTCRVSRSAIFRDKHVIMATPKALLGGHILSLRTQLRAIPLFAKTFAAWPSLDMHAFWKAARYDNRSVAAMLSSKRSNELLEYALQPILNGYFYWTPEHTSEAMMLILCKAAFSRGTYKMRGGLQRIPEKAAERSMILLQHTVEEIKSSEKSHIISIKHNAHRKMLKADGIVCATTASVVPKIFPSLTDPQREFFRGAQYSSSALVANTYREEQTHSNRAIVFPRREETGLSAVTLAPEEAESGQMLATVKVYASGTTANQFGKFPDKKLAQRLLHEMERARSAVLIGTPSPVATHVQRWPEALPFFDVGHFKRLLAFESGEIENGDQPIVFAGDYIGGPFMEGAFTSGIRAAERLDSRLCQHGYTNQE